MLCLIGICRTIYYLAWRFRHLRMYKHPEQVIPDHTLYCYMPVEYRKDGSTRIYLCPFHKHFVWDLCMYNNSDCCGDWCKTCGINDDYQEEE
jgi:hypothetical protein